MTDYIGIRRGTYLVRLPVSLVKIKSHTRYPVLGLWLKMAPRDLLFQDRLM